MNRNKPIALLVTAVLLASALVCGMVNVQTRPAVPVLQQTATADSPAPWGTAPDDLRGVWVNYMELSMAYESDQSEAAFRNKFEAIAADCAALGCNTLFVQVRPFCDALYVSAVFPPSHVLSGEQGKSAGYDALQIMCEICRKKGLQIHAWVNPYRVTANGTPAHLGKTNPVVQDKTLALTTDSGMILNPSSEKARRLITEGVTEIVKNYDVDGVQFDDYFYPEDIGDADRAQYAAYTESVPQGQAMDIGAWRQANVNLLLSETLIAVHRANPNAVFGVSPQGHLANNALLYADVKSWCEVRGYVDYICPQLYFSLDNPALGFEAALNDWTALDFAEDVRLYAGLAGYKAGTDADEGTWENRDAILQEEVNILNKNKKVSGWVLYSYASLHEEAAQEEILHLQKSVTT